VSENRAESVHFCLTEENETRFFELSRLDQRFPKSCNKQETGKAV
jgi:hypothetical protein